MALPTIKPSATDFKSRTCSGVLMPKPTQIGSVQTARNVAIVSGRSIGNWALTPVTPSREMR